MTPLITTIIPTYKRPERLRKAIQSVLDQTFQDFQLCIYDNASGDSTTEIVAEFASKDPRIKYYCHNHDIGAIENYQYGISRVDTPYFSVLSDDDYLLPKFYETTLKGFNKYPDVAFSAGAVLEVEDSGEIIRNVLSEWPDQEYFASPEGFLEMITKYSNWMGSLFRTETVRQIGKLDTSIKAMDHDFCLRIAARFPFAISKKQVAVFVSHPGSYSRKYKLKLLWPGVINMTNNLKNVETLSEKMKEKAEFLLKKTLEEELLRVALRSLEKGDYLDASKANSYFAETSCSAFKKVILLATVKICSLSQGVHWVFVKVLQLRRMLKKSFAKRKCKMSYGN